MMLVSFSDVPDVCRAVIAVRRKSCSVNGSHVAAAVAFTAILANAASLRDIAEHVTA